MADPQGISRSHLAARRIARVAAPLRASAIVLVAFVVAQGTAPGSSRAAYFETRALRVLPTSNDPDNNEETLIDGTREARHTHEHVAGPQESRVVLRTLSYVSSSTSLAPFMSAAGGERVVCHSSCALIR